MIRSELLKLKRTSLPWICLVAAISIPLIFFINLSTETEDLPPLKKDPWNLIIVECWKGMNFLVLPLFVILITTMVSQLEHRNNTWKQVHAAPVPALKIFLSKFLVVQIIIISFLLLFNAANILLPILLPFTNPEVSIIKPLDWQSILKINYQTYFSITGISAIQFFLGMQFRSIMIPLSIGFGLWLMLPLAAEMNWAHLDKYPYAYPAFVVFPKYHTTLVFTMFASFAYSLIFFTLTILSFNQRKIKV